MTIEQIKQRFGIIGSSPMLYRAIDIAMQVAATDLTVLITGESGVGKENFPKIIHSLSSRKHGEYIAINCGAIPEGTIDSELFGHEKGSFTDAREARKGYFEVADKGTIFLDEVAELPLQTQVRLLRVLETGEFMRVGSSKVIKTNVRVVAATNVNIPNAISQGKFREDLYYRLNTVPIFVPPLRERKEDIHLLFRKFSSDFADKYRMPVLRLTDEALELFVNYQWKGNVRQLKNITEQISIIEQERLISDETLKKYLPVDLPINNLPIIFSQKDADSGFSERELLYKILFEMKKDISDLKGVIANIAKKSESDDYELYNDSGSSLYSKFFDANQSINKSNDHRVNPSPINNSYELEDSEEVIEESLSLEDTEVSLIKRALTKHRGKRKNAANELGISERTLYRKIKEYNIKE